MFEKKKHSLYNQLDDSKTIVYDFLLRSTALGFESYRAPDYRMYNKLDEEEMIAKLDEELEKFLSGDVDSGNKNMLDDYILAELGAGITDLLVQKNEHADIIQRLSCRQKVDPSDLFAVKEMLEKNLAELCGIRDNIKEAMKETGGSII